LAGAPAADFHAAIRSLVLTGAARGAENLATRASFGLPALVKALTGNATPPTLGLVTGFPVRLGDGQITFETDGPLGAGHLALAATLLGWRTILVTDSAFSGMIDAIAATARVHGLAFNPDILLLEARHRQQAYQAEALARLASAGLTHLIAVERPGRARDGGHYSMRGDRIDDAFIPSDFLFEQAQWVTAGFADGGNEIGMGRIGQARIAAHIAHGGTIASRMRVDHLTLCGVSNWGAYALVALLALAVPNKRSALMDLLTPETDAELMTALLAAGAVDGVTRMAAPTVDGLAIEVHHEKIAALRALVSAQPMK
jgi:D-glutamate cyclase